MFRLSLQCQLHQFEKVPNFMVSHLWLFFAFCIPVLDCLISNSVLFDLQQFCSIGVGFIMALVHFSSLQILKASQFI